MSNRPNDKDDWSYDTASLFRAARRAHLDSTPLRRARLAAVWARIQAGTLGAAASNGSRDLGARATTRAISGRATKVLLAVVGVAAVSVAFISAHHRSSESARNADTAPSALESPLAPVGLPPATVPIAPRNEPREAPVARVESESHARDQRRRLRADAGRQRLSAEIASAPEASITAIDSRSIGAPAAANAATQNGHAKLRTSVAAAAAPREAAPSATSSVADVQESVSPAARIADRPPPDDAAAELDFVKRMHAALRKADFSAALVLSAEHERRWPHGVFELEREGVRVIAACSARSNDAILRAKHFLTAHPDAPLAMRASSACAAQLARGAVDR